MSSWTVILAVFFVNSVLAQQGQPPPVPNQQQQLNAQQQAQLNAQQQQAQFNAQQAQMNAQQQAQMNQQMNNPNVAVPQPPAPRNFAADNEIKDQQHIASHLDGQINVDESKMTNEQLQFHYFTMHDLDKDNRLDGTELIKAITHWHGDDKSEHQPPKVTDQELEDMIDSILKDDDFNNDGFVDYSEFLKSQAGRA